MMMSQQPKTQEHTVQPQQMENLGEQSVAWELN